MASKPFDIAVIGAGIVGCATARQLVHTFPNRSLIVFERRGGPGEETSAASSGVIHSGLHLDPASLKAKLAVHGRTLVLDSCTRYGVPMHHCGMHVVVSPRDAPHLIGEVFALRALLRRARAQGVEASVISPWRVRRNESAVRALLVISIPDVTVIDVPALVRALATDATRHGATFRYHTAVDGVSPLHDAYALMTADGPIRTRSVVNTAGLGATRIAALAGFPHHRVTLYRGEYYEVTDSALRDAVCGLVYPVYRPGSPGLGIHLTKTVDGRLLVGPNAQPIDRHEAIDDNRTPPDAFFNAVHPFLPALRLEHLRFSHAGIRTKHDDGRIESDFSITLDREDPPFVNCIGIESPGITASLAIAEHVAELLTPVLQ
ncbi:FAD-dependent oxidoreductase [Candidatus Uhrbacteria bacterium]|nr:FAD-dependent oxidoreductase [Candidatus Uhrbacteria bacterium]